MIQRVLTLGHQLVDPLLRFNFIDRSLALGAFGALIPLMIVLQSSEGKSMGAGRGGRGVRIAAAAVHP